MTQCNQKMKVKAVMTIFGRSLTSGDLCVHFFNSFWNHFHSWNTLSTSLCSSFPFRTYCISQGMVRVCPFAIFLIGPWLEIDSSASEQFWLNEQFGPNAERFTDVWALTYFCMATCSLLAIHRLMERIFSSISVGSWTSCFSRWFCKSVESFSVQVWFAPCMIGFALLGTVTLSARCRRGVYFLSGAKHRRNLLSMASLVSQLTPGVSQLWVSTGLSASGKQSTASSF